MKISCKTMRIFAALVLLIFISAAAGNQLIINTNKWGDWHMAERTCEKLNSAIVFIKTNEEYQVKIAQQPQLRTIFWANDRRKSEGGKRCETAYGWMSQPTFSVQSCQNYYLIVCEKSGSGGKKPPSKQLSVHGYKTWAAAERICAQVGGKILSINSDEEYYAYLRTEKRLKTMVWVQHKFGSKRNVPCTTTNAWEEVPNFKVRFCGDHHAVVCEGDEEKERKAPITGRI